MIALVSLAATLIAQCPNCIGAAKEMDSESSAVLLHVADPDGLAQAIFRHGGGPCATVHHARSTDQGLSWSSPKLVDTDPVYAPCPGDMDGALASDGVEYSYIVFTAQAGGTGPPTLVVKASPDRGLNWPAQVTPIATLQSASASYNLKALAASGREAWVMWLDGPSATELHILLSRTQDGGQSWTTPLQVDSGLSTGILGFIAILGPGGSLLVTLATNEGGWLSRLYFMRSDDGGVSWTAPLSIDDLAAPAEMAHESLLAFADGQILVAWADNRAGSSDVWSRASLDGGVTWSGSVERIDTGDTPGASPSGLPLLARTGTERAVVATWLEYRDSMWRIWINYSHDGGLTWGGPGVRDAEPLSASSSEARPLHYALSGHPEGWVTVAWEDSVFEYLSRCGQPLCPALYTSTSCDAGQSFEPWRRVLDLDGGNSVGLIPFPGAADNLVFLRSYPSTAFLRIDGPTVAEPRGPVTYCVGSDPPVEAQAVSAGCPGGLSLQWYVDGVAIPGATGAVYQPALPAGDHRVEVRGSCPTNPSCAPASIATVLHPRAPQIPPDVGNRLLGVRQGSAAWFDWSTAPSAQDSHAHVRRAPGVRQPWIMLAPDPLAARDWLDAPPAGPTLYLYDVRQADLCEAESAN